jgi:branched-chain amino acid transport system substrate-binding protein
MKKTWIVIAIVVIVALAALLIITQIKRGAGEIKIGFVNSLTGQYAPYGENNWNGVMIAVEEINIAGGINGKRINLIVEDDGSTKEGAVFAVKKLIEIDKVPVIIGPGSTVGVAGTSAIANKAKVVLFSPGAAGPGITTKGGYVFRNRVSGDLEAPKIAEYAITALKLKKAAILYPNVDYGVGFKNSFKTKFISSGGEVITEETYADNDTDFRSQLNKIKMKSPELVYVLGVPESVGQMLRQAKEIGLKTQFISNNVESSKLIEIAKNSAEGLIFPTETYDPNSALERIKQFEKKYFFKFNRRSDLFAANGYDAVYIVSQAIEKSGYKGEDIKNVLYNLKNFPGVGGNISFDEKGDVIKPISIKMVKGGEFKIIEEAK